MALKPFTTPATAGNRGIVWQWSLAQNDTCAPASVGDYTDLSVQVEGTFNGATVTLQGTNDADQNYHGLHDPTVTTAISFAAAGLAQVLEHTQYMKPVMTGSGASTALNVFLFGVPSAKG